MGIMGALNMTLQKKKFAFCSLLLIFFKYPNFDNFKAIPDKRTQQKCRSVWMSNLLGH